MKLFIMSLLFTACCAVPTDLSGKMFSFPVRSATAHVKLLPEESNFTSLTVCLRFLTDLKHSYALFSMASNAADNDFLIFKSAARRFLVFVRGKHVTFDDIPDEPNTCYSMCSTWDGTSKLVELWTNGLVRTHEARFQGNLLDGVPYVVLGQDQDTVGGGFSASQSFVGNITDVHMWNYVLPDQEIQAFTNDRSFSPGNVINWRALDFISAGNVVLAGCCQNGCCHNRCCGVQS